MIRISHHCCIACSLCLLFLAVLPTLSATEAALGEQDIQAALLDKFIQLVEWPQSESLPQDVYIVSVLEDREMYALLAEHFEGHAIHNRKVVFLFCQHFDEITPSHVILFPKSLSDDPAPYIAKLGATPTLTVGYDETFTENGGMIAYTRSDNHVRFEINLDAAEKVGIQISYHLARYATAVHGGKTRL